MLKAVSLQRFKNLEMVRIPLGSINVLVGTNNSGKSSVLQGIAFAVSVAQTSRLLGDATTMAAEQLIYAPVRDVLALAKGGTLRQTVKSAIEVEFISYPRPALPGALLPAGAIPDPVSKVQVRRGKNLNLSVEIKQSHGSKLNLSSLAPPFCIYVPGLAGIPAIEQYRTPAALRRAAARGDANSVLRNILWALHEDSPAWGRFAANLAEIFPDHVISMKFDPDRDEAIGATVASPGGDLPLDAAGTGFLQAVQILAYAAKDAPPLLLLDEPDAHLHPDKQRQLVKLLTALSLEGKFQVIIATHSRHVIDALDSGAKIHWMSNGKLRPSDETDAIAVLTELGALDKGDRLRAGHIDVVLLTEDSDPKVIKPLLVSSGFASDRVEIWSYKTCTQIEKAKLLSEFIRSHAPGTEIIIHTDRDYRTDEEIDVARASFLASNLTLFVTGGTDAESHYISVSHVQELIKGIDISEITAAVVTAQKSARLESETRLSRAIYRRAKQAAHSPHHEPNPVTTVDEARKLLDANPTRWTYGKKAFGVFVGELQRGRGTIKLLVETKALSVPELNVVAARCNAKRAAEFSPPPLPAVPVVTLPHIPKILIEVPFK